MQANRPNNRQTHRAVKAFAGVCLVGAVLAGTPLASGMSMTELACGAKLCLGGDGGGPCKPFLKVYKSIEGVTPSITRKLRKRFLAQCQDKKPPNLEAMKAARAADIETLHEPCPTEILNDP